MFDSGVILQREIRCWSPSGLHLTEISVNTGPSTASVCFHPHCGSLIKLSNSNRTAERQRPTEEFKNAVTLTNIPLRNDEAFEVSVTKNFVLKVIFFSNSTILSCHQVNLIFIPNKEIGVNALKQHCVFRPRGPHS